MGVYHFSESVSRASKPVKTTDTVSITPATNWVFNNKGEVTLVSTVTQTDAYSANAHQAACLKPK
ncbi:hypothetical protein H6G76_36225 [Nostoc sp. FACHB-152]|uniref:hypothetical protein n=1 Tax=Nostoc sp. FACHB-145 TaxID=2692836 RepID=UPI001685F352|nr:hypothetical protein [Nostoc sp. FACHB-145]MBD2452451.1 hypothetical protein [Nostoc sp. FACHB-152]MBD2473194.1 hypothetical protein [Nostoc sp. FACHB-145]